jgi:hypothetical protein
MSALVSFPKMQLTRSKSYREYVAKLDCIACGISGYSQAAHPCGGRGLGQKADDLAVFPLCCTRPGIVGCHVEHDQLLNGLTLGIRRELEAKYTAATQSQARRDGRKEFA